MAMRPYDSPQKAMDEGPATGGSLSCSRRG
jgi:hypothetical protein